MNLLHVVAHFYLGGSERVATQLCTGLVRRGHTCHILAITTPNTPDPVGEAMKDELHSAGVRLHEFRGSSFRMAAISAPLRLARLWADLKPDIVHAHTDRPDFVVSLASRLRPMSLARTIHNTELWGTHFVLGYIAESGFTDDLVISVSEPSRGAYRALRKRYGLNESAFQRIICNGVDTPPLTERALRQDLGTFGADLARLQLCFAGRFTRQKGFDVLVAALERLDQALLNRIEIHAFGAGEELDTLAARARKQALPVRFHAPVPKVNRWFSAFDAVVIPSRFEGQPLVALEALIAGVPVIATAAPGLREALPDTWPLLAQAENPISLANQIASFAAAPNSFAGTARDAATQARVLYDSNRMVEEYESAYQDYLAHRMARTVR